MKSTMTLTELASEIERREKAKKDFIAPTSKLRLSPELELEMEAETFGVGDIAHDNLSGGEA